MKSQLSLRIQTNNQPICPAWTKDETHLGSQFDSAWAQEELAEGEYESDKESNDKSGSSTLTIAPSINPGFQICLDLLTSELTAAFFQRHPMEDQKRASRLQIQLLIEAYEDLLQQVQQRQGGLHISSVSEEEWEDSSNLL
ncbi:hypothetical protein M7I_3075 [Glarea lozoyensis 74030]|uniref:Uncharacterized protein n=1 Tax=Glarea lozoyensis (strain ATCC 74030 / MF5533) TaxID=1104152 RepID=H0EKH7_GLAL7|nr:hypothetical protein M7I_3075 [Glarea lozoyensis 74030]